MKTRTGFVSNSSSTSFCIYGIDLDATMNWDEMSELSQKLRDDGLEVHSDDCDEIYVGRSWAEIKDDETGAQFKENVEKALRFHDLLGDRPLGTHEHAWYCG